MKDLHSKLAIVNAFGPVVLAADNTPAAIDLQGFNAAEIELAIGVGGITFDATNKIEFKLTHSDDNVSYSAVTDADMLGVSGIANGIIKSLVAAHAAAESCRYGYKGGKRYLKLLADFSGTHGTGTPLYAAVIKGSGYNNPQPNAA
ncbi:hypothetical protein LB572_01050 [Mesorhizobium sp. BH1-1-5]|uniref:hypothetical protein n=1 Tax=Mesorhizobium sp. BH1-1-5 TaxID=2876661 RepID=UPI001CCC3791|nr:hypothetical protein [Mesorhizobium sp. BH1-1-5]MBZ9985676.1 hypothetical protein [Mesorhizobium sp. BH1-1-5]